MPGTNPLNERALISSMYSAIYWLRKVLMVLEPNTANYAEVRDAIRTFAEVIDTAAEQQ